MKKFLPILMFGLGSFTVNADSVVSVSATSAAKFTAASALQVNKQDPYSMIKSVAEITFARFDKEYEQIRKQPNLLKDIVRDELMPYVDYRYSALKIIGLKNSRFITKAEFEEFVIVFREYLVSSYAQVFTLYNKQEVLFAPAKPFADKKIVAVDTSVIEPKREPINISFRVKKDKNNLEWKAYDMVAEGISLLDTKQSELSSIIRQKGLPYVTQLLKEKADQDIQFKTAA